MPSLRITKTNIDKDDKAAVAKIAKRQKVSATKMLSMMIHFYLANNG